MKKKLIVILALVLCVAIALPVAAVASGFVPSIMYRGGPRNRSGFMGGFDSNGVFVGDESVGSCIVVTTIEQARDKETDISQDERDLLIETYEKLEKGEMTLPITGDHVIRDLVDISFAYNNCRLHANHGDKPASLAEENVVVKLDLDMDIEADAKLMVLTYINGVWTEIKSVENNGNGTVTCIFEDLCPVAFVVLG